MATTPMDPGNQAVRQTLIDKYGVSNDRIGYNNQSGFVQIDGQDVLKPANVQQGTSYAPQSVFNSASGKINQLNRMYELQNQVMNPQQQVNPMDQQFNDLLGRLRGAVDQASAPVDPYGTPQYEAAQAQVQRGAHQATRQAQEVMGDSGLARSSIVADRAQGIQNDANQYLETQLVPQIVDEIQAERAAQVNNLLALLNPVAQQQSLYDQRAQTQRAQAADVLDFLIGREDREEELARQDERYAIEDARYEDERDYIMARDAIADERYKAEFDENVRQFGLNYALDRARLDQQISDAAASRALQSRSLDMQQTARQDAQAAQDAADQRSTAQRSYETMVLSELSNLAQSGGTREDFENFLRMNAGDIAANLGREGYDALYDQIEQFSNAPATDNSNQELRQRALELATRDLRWEDELSPDEREALIQDYVQYLGG